VTVSYILRRFGVFLFVVWGAATFSFFLPRIADVNPIEERMAQLASRGAVSVGNTEAMIKNYEKRFGLDKPLAEQYVRYLWNTARFDFGFSIAFFPTKVGDIIREALPWTLVLLTVVTFMNFVIGVLLGAVLAWPRAPSWVKVIAPPFMGLSAIPYYLIGIALIYLFAFSWEILPISGGYDIGKSPQWTTEFIWDAVRHSMLPGASIILAGVGFWAIGMRGMMTMTMGDDYMILAEAKGLKGWRLFTWYGMRNAMLPQITALALSLGHIVSGAILVEVVFSYPGIGGMLVQAIRNFDFTLLYGIVYLTILGIALATLILDLIYPKLDPRITYEKG
jgi:peptide/nickel transport system permease protein